MADVAEKEIPTTTVVTEIDFDDAFARLAELEDGKEPDLSSAKAEEKPEEAPAEGTQDAAGEAKEGEQPAEGASAAPEPPAPAAEPPKAAETPLEKVKEAQPGTDDVLARLASLMKEGAPAPKAPEPAAPAAEPPAFSPEEQQFLANYEKEWPDVAKAESMRRRVEYRQLVGYVFNEIAKEIRPMVETLQVLTTRTQYSDLKATVSDYDDVRDKVIDWVETQPTYLQQAYKHVIENGTVEEVADLVGRYKRETGVQAALSAAPAPAPAKKETELPSATKQAAAALAPVSSKRSAVTSTIDPNDFESAFASFASKM